VLIIDNTAFALWVLLVLPPTLRMSRDFLALAAAQVGGPEAFDRSLSAKLFSLMASTRPRPQLIGGLILPQKDPQIEDIRRRAVRSIAWWIAWLIVAWVIAYTASFYVSLDDRVLTVVQIGVFGGGVAYLLRQLFGPAEGRWVPRTLAITSTIAGVVLIVLTIALPTRL
jgi:hypothetical protein